MNPVTSLRTILAKLDPCVDVTQDIEAAVEELPDGSCAIRSGCCDALDAARDRIHGTRRWLAGLERSERDRTGIRSLKVGYNKVFGYYLEVTRPNLALVPEDYVRKQTIANGERFITAPLKEAESRILSSDEEIAALEREVLADLSARVTAHAGRLIETARQLAELGCAELAGRGRGSRELGRAGAG